MKLADFIEQSDSFSMHRIYWHPYNREIYGKDIKNTDEGCPACILGHLRVMEGHSPSDERFPATQSLEISLEISSEESEKIVRPESSIAYYAAFPGDSNYITKNRACNMLRNFAETKKVEWRVDC